jgi:hypothetical protein
MILGKTFRSNFPAVIIRTAQISIREHALHFTQSEYRARRAEKANFSARIPFIGISAFCFQIAEFHLYCKVAQMQSCIESWHLASIL